MAEKEQYIGKSELKGKPDRPLSFKLKDGIVKTRHLEDGAVTTLKIKDGAVTPEKVSDDMAARLVLPVTDSLDEKYTNITNGLYSMVESVQQGGIALSQQFGNRTDIGISQKTLTKALGKFWDEMGRITGKDYMDFTLTVVPATTYSEAPQAITITADCSDAISNFDNIRIYVDNVLIGESGDVETYTKAYTISRTSVVKAVGIILGKQVTKTVTAVKEIPFFMGSGHDYHDVINEDCRKELVGTLEGDYNLTVKSNGDYIYVLIPISRREEFRRCKMDMSGIELQFTEEPHSRFLVCKSINTFNAGEYNIDIDINS